MARKPKQVEELHILHASQQFNDSFAFVASDLNFVFNQKPDIATFTELTEADNHRPILARVARERGYRPILMPFGVQMAVNTRKNLRVEDQGFIPVHPGLQGPGGATLYGPKGIAWIKVRFHGKVMWVHSAHWVTKAQYGGLAKERHVKMSNAMSKVVSDRGQRGPAFFSGDVNADPDQAKYPTQIFRKNKMITCWDDANKQIATYPTGSSLDVIGRYARGDTQFKRFFIHPYQHSDHRPFSAVYNIRIGDNGDDGDRGEKPDTKPKPGPKTLTPRVRSFADYTDKELYNLPAATDDSDTFNG